MNPVGEDELVGVAYANDRVEAEMIQGLLESAGVPSVLQPAGVDGPSLGIGWLNPGWEVSTGHGPVRSGRNYGLAVGLFA